MKTFLALLLLAACGDNEPPTSLNHVGDECTNESECWPDFPKGHPAACVLEGTTTTGTCVLDPDYCTGPDPYWQLCPPR